MKNFVFLTVMIATIAGPAHAGPVAAAIAWVGTAMASAGVAGAIARMAVSAGLSLLSSALSRGAAAKPKINVQFDVDFGDDTPLSFIAGDYVTAGKLKYVGTWGKNNRYVTQVFEISSLPITGLDSAWFGDEVGDIRWTSPATEQGQLMGYPIKNFSEGSNKERDRAWIKVVNGSQTAADPFLTKVFSTDKDYPWTSAMVGRGKAYVILTWYYDPEAMTSVPTALFKPAPAPMYDPRKDSTAGGSGAHRWGNRATYEATRNPAIIAYNITRGIYFGQEWLFGGRNLPAWRLPRAEWFAAMNACDATVAIKGGTEPAFRCGMQITVDMTAADVLEEIGRAANMRFAEVGGRLKPIVGLPGAAAFAFTDESILITEGQSYKPFNGLGETFNALSATYPEPDEKWSSKDAPEYIDTEGMAADGGRYLPTTLSYPAAPFRLQVQRLMRAQMRDYRRMRVHQFHLPPEAYALEPLVDMVSWASERNGYQNKLFVVEQVDPTPGMNVLVTLREVDPGDYDWSSDYQKPVTIIPPAAPGVFVQVVNGLTVAPVVVANAANDRKRAAIKVTCDGDEVGVTRIQIQARVKNTTEITTETLQKFEAPFTWYLLDVVPATDYEVRAKLLSSKTSLTQWSNWIGVRTDDVGSELPDEIRQQLTNEMTDIAKKAGVTPVTALPASGQPNQIVMLVPDGILYRWDASKNQWVNSVFGGIPDGYLDATKFAQGLEPVKIITSGALPTTKQTTNIVYGGKLYTWDGSKYATPSFALTDGMVEARHLANNAVTTIKIADGAINDAKIAGLAAGKITGQLTDAQIAAVAAAKLTGQLSGAQLADAAITAAKLGPLAVESSHLANNAVTATKIADGSVTTPKLVANSVVSDKIAAQAVVASKLAVADFTNLVADDQMQDAGSWSQWGATFDHYPISHSNNARSVGSFRYLTDSATATTADLRTRNFFPVTPGDELFCAAQCYRVNGTKMQAALQVMYYDKADAYLSLATFWSYNGTASPSSDLKGDLVVPSGAFQARFRYLITRDGTDADLVLASPTIRIKNKGELIVDGAIIAVKIASGAIETAKLAAGAVIADKIATDAIIARTIAANAVTAAAVAANAIQAVNIVSNAITAAKVAANAIEAEALAANAVTAAKVAANAIVAGKLAADSVSASNLQTDSVTANALRANSVTTAAIAAGAVNTDQLAARAVVASKLAVADFTNLVADDQFQDSNSWDVSSPFLFRTTTPISAIKSIGHVLYVNADNASNNNVGFASRNYFPVTPGDELFCSAQMVRREGTKISATMQVMYYDRDGGYISLSNGPMVNGNGNAATTYSASLIVPDGVFQARVRGWVYGADTDANIYFGALTVRMKNKGELIVDGAISANKLATDSVTANAIAAGAVVASAIAAGAVTAAKITVANLAAISANLGAITAGSLNINNNFIVTSAGVATIRSGTSGERMVMTNSRIDVYDSKNVVRVRIGSL